MAEHSNNLVWMDLEFSGLDPNENVILEIATLVTDSQLNILAEGPNLAINHPLSVLEAMDNWNREHHKKSGLWQRVLQSDETHESAEDKILAFLRPFCPQNTCPLCGNSIHNDRFFLHIHMPHLNEYLHYRNVDVSTIKELVKRWYPALPKFQKQGLHQALADIRESIDELKYYREKVLIASNAT